MITSTKLKELSSYKKLDNVQQIMVKKHKNVKKINHHLELIKNMGYKKWLLLSNLYYLNKLLIDEIIKNDL
tara:strand:- start:7767 stop:7979 length:213 start_codon:yes stop_codon:yes gene_type:complete